jgi:hypothetical protein
VEHGHAPTVLPRSGNPHLNSTLHTTHSTLQKKSADVSCSDRRLILFFITNYAAALSVSVVFAALTAAS